MGKTTGFMEWERAAPHRRPIALRVLDWKEVEELDPPATTRHRFIGLAASRAPLRHGGPSRGKRRSS